MVFFPVLFSSNLSPNGSGILDLSLQNLHLFWRDRDFQVVFCIDLFFNLEKIKNLLCLPPQSTCFIRDFRKI